MSQLISCSRFNSQGAVHRLVVNRGQEARALPIIPATKTDLEQRIESYFKGLTAVSSAIFITEPTAARPINAIRHECKLKHHSMEIITGDKDVVISVFGELGKTSSRTYSLTITPEQHYNKVKLEVYERPVSARHENGKSASMKKVHQTQEMTVPKRFKLHKAIDSLVKEIPPEIGKGFMADTTEIIRGAALGLTSMDKCGKYHLKDVAPKAVEAVSEAIALQAGGDRRSR